MPDLSAARYYVYQLVDPRNQKPFYIGKGSNQRAWEHQKEVEKGTATCNADKIAVIREILTSGMKVVVQILADFFKEIDALRLEAQLIETTPGLVNIARHFQGYSEEVWGERVRFTRRRDKSFGEATRPLNLSGEEWAKKTLVDIENWVGGLFSSEPEEYWSRRGRCWRRVNTEAQKDKILAALAPVLLPSVRGASRSYRNEVLSRAATAWIVNSRPKMKPWTKTRKVFQEDKQLET